MALNPRRVWCSKQIVLLPHHLIDLRNPWLATAWQVCVVCAGVLLLCLPKPGLSQAGNPRGHWQKVKLLLTEHLDLLVHLCD